MVKKLSAAAVIGALYAALTLLLSPISFGVMQIRASEALCAFALITPAAIPGLTVGCFLANIIGPGGIADALLGSAATLFGCWLMYLLRGRPLLAPLCNCVSNGVIVGLMLYYTSGIGISPLLCILWVAAGELIACYALGYPLYRYLSKHHKELGL